MYSFIKLGRHVSFSEKMDPIDFGGDLSEIKGQGQVQLDMYGNKLVNTIKTKQLCASSSNLADMSAMVRG